MLYADHHIRTSNDGGIEEVYSEGANNLEQIQGKTEAKEGICVAHKAKREIHGEGEQQENRRVGEWERGREQSHPKSDSLLLKFVGGNLGTCKPLWAMPWPPRLG